MHRRVQDYFSSLLCPEVNGSMEALNGIACEPREGVRARAYYITQTHLEFAHHTKTTVSAKSSCNASMHKDDQQRRHNDAAAAAATEDEDDSKKSKAGKKGQKSPIEPSTCDAFRRRSAVDRVFHDADMGSKFLP
jgi:hypothetical protein